MYINPWVSLVLQIGHRTTKAISKPKLQKHKRASVQTRKDALQPSTSNPLALPCSSTNYPQTLSTLLALATLGLAAPAPATGPISISVNVYNDTACAIPDVEGYIFYHNQECLQFITTEASVKATSAKAVKPGCVLQVFADTSCTDVLAAITPDGTCQAPLLGPVSSGWLVGC